MKSIRKTIEIKASAQAIFNFITQPTNFPSVWPSMIEVSNVTWQADGNHEFDWVYKMAGIHFRGHAKTTEIRPGKLSRVRNDSGIKSEFTWTLQGRDGAGTTLTLDVTYTIPAPVIGKLAESLVVKMNEREMETMLSNLKEVIESTASKATVVEHHR